MLKSIVARLVPAPSVANATAKLTKAAKNLKVVSQHHLTESDRKAQRAGVLQAQAVQHTAEAGRALRIHDKLSDLLA